MSLANAPDPALREAVVQQDLGNVLHPIVQHKVLESKQMVSPEARVPRSSTPTAPNTSTPWPAYGASISATAGPNWRTSPPTRCASSPISRTPR